MVSQWIQNHDSRTTLQIFDYSRDFWGSHRTGRTAPLTCFYTSDALKVLKYAPQNTFALFDVQLSLSISLDNKWKLYINTTKSGLHVSGSGHDGFGADTGSIARQTSALINEDNEIFKKRYGYSPDDYLNFEYADIFMNYKEQLEQAANTNSLRDYEFLLDLIKEKFNGN